MKFIVHGDFITERIRDHWRSDLPKAAFELCDSMSMTREQSFELILGKMIFTGTTEEDGTFGWEIDSNYNDPTKFGMDLSIDGVMIRLFKNYKETLAHLTGQRRTERLYIGQDFQEGVEYSETEPWGQGMRASNIKQDIVKSRKRGTDRLTNLQVKHDKLVENIECLLPHSSFKLSDFAKISVQISESFDALSDVEIEKVIETHKQREFVDTEGGYLALITKTAKEVQKREDYRTKNWDKIQKEEFKKAEQYKSDMIDRIMRIQQQGILQEIYQSGKQLDDLKEDYLQALSDSITDPVKKEKFEYSRTFLRNQRISKKLLICDGYNSKVKEFNQRVEKFNTEMKPKEFMTDENSKFSLELAKEAYILEKEENELYDKGIGQTFKNKHSVIIEKLKYPVPEFVEITEHSSEHAYITPDGRFYPTLFEQHIYLEQEMYKSGLYPEFSSQGYGNDWAGENLIKISHGEVQWGNHKTIKDPEDRKKETLIDLRKTDKQLETLMMWMLLKGEETYNTWMSKGLTPDQLIQYIKDREN